MKSGQYAIVDGVEYSASISSGKVSPVIYSPHPTAQPAAYDRLVRESPEVIGTKLTQYGATAAGGFVS